VSAHYAHVVQELYGFKVLVMVESLTEMSTRFISWGKGGRCVRLTTLPPSCAVVLKSGNLNFLEASGPLKACNGTALPLPIRGGISWLAEKLLVSQEGLCSQ